MNRIPAPVYEKDVATLVRYFRRAMAEIDTELMRMDLSDFRRANALVVQAQIREILKDLDVNITAWASTTFPKAAQEGVARSIVSLGVAETFSEAMKLVKFNELNKSLIELAIADTQADLLQVTQNIDRKTRNAIRQAMADVMRVNMAQGVNGVRSIRRDFLAEARRQLGDSISTGIIDASNRRWKPTDYADMVTRTKLHTTYREAARNDAIDRGALYGVISSHGATDACRNWEGKVVKFVPDAPGPYPYIGDLPRREIFHPRCRHHVSPIRRPDLA
ncbi:phage minor capsid protein [Rossellomorea sp. RS05]|uniref:phage minor capsid protein n=1 Tax=Rossellomorea sp. RS05 TaxID=3149166 RepID=UPI003221ED44